MTKSVDELCRERDIQFAKLVEQCGLDEQRVMAVMLGRWTPSPSERHAIAAVFEVEVDDITWGHRTPIQHIYGHGPG